METGGRTEMAWFEVQADQLSRDTSQMVKVSRWEDRGPVGGVDPVVLADQEGLS